MNFCVIFVIKIVFYLNEMETMALYIKNWLGGHCGRFCGSNVLWANSLLTLSNTLPFYIRGSPRIEMGIYAFTFWDE